MNPVTTDKRSNMPAWYLEMIDPQFHAEQCAKRAQLLAMMRPK